MMLGQNLTLVQGTGRHRGDSHRKVMGTGRGSSLAVAAERGSGYHRSHQHLEKMSFVSA